MAHRPRNIDETMEAPTPFDLNRAIQLWRENLAPSPAFHADNLDELESHLRESIDALQSRGRAAEEAFAIATRRIGGGNALQAEFAKVNVRAVWLDRILWMLVALQGWLLVLTAYSSAKTLVHGATGLAVALDPWMKEQTYLHLNIALPPVLLALFLALGAVAGWTFMRKSGGLARGFHIRSAVSPLKLAVIFFLICAGLRLLADACAWYLPKSAAHRVSLPSWQFAAASLFGLVLPAACLLLTRMIDRKRLRATAS